MNDMYPRVVADPSAPKPGLMERVRDLTITGERRVEPFNFSATVSQRLWVTWISARKLTQSSIQSPAFNSTTSKQPESSSINYTTESTSTPSHEPWKTSHLPSLKSQTRNSVSSSRSRSCMRKTCRQMIRALSWIRSSRSVMRRVSGLQKRERSMSL